jgi:hypothetical protein
LSSSPSGAHLLRAQPLLLPPWRLPPCFLLNRTPLPGKLRCHGFSPTAPCSARPSFPHCSDFFHVRHAASRSPSSLSPMVGFQPSASSSAASSWPRSCSAPGSLRVRPRRAERCEVPARKLSVGRARSPLLAAPWISWPPCLPPLSLLGLCSKLGPAHLPVSSLAFSPWTRALCLPCRARFHHAAHGRSSFLSLLWRAPLLLLAGCAPSPASCPSMLTRAQLISMATARRCPLVLGPRPAELLLYLLRRPVAPSPMLRSSPSPMTPSSDCALLPDLVVPAMAALSPCSALWSSPMPLGLAVLASLTPSLLLSASCLRVLCDIESVTRARWTR